MGKLLNNICEILILFMLLLPSVWINVNPMLGPIFYLPIILSLLFFRGIFALPALFLFLLINFGAGLSIIFECYLIYLAYLIHLEYFGPLFRFYSLKRSLIGLMLQILVTGLLFLVYKERYGSDGVVSWMWIWISVNYIVQGFLFYPYYFPFNWYNWLIKISWLEFLLGFIIMFFMSDFIMMPLLAGICLPRWFFSIFLNFWIISFSQYFDLLHVFVLLISGFYCYDGYVFKNLWRNFAKILEKNN